MNTFAFSSLEQQQQIFNNVTFAPRNSTFMAQDKITHNLQAIFYLAGMKTFVGLKFINGKVQIDWEDLELFWPDKSY